ncbi:MAG TPA: hypothetical protein VE055_00840 [Gaiellaceae bacterium]|nr:hypothetical protein [Gaiellaceae bacterium]
MSRGIAAYLRRHHLALLALFVALGGTSVAATALVPRNSVGSGQVINGSLQKADLSKKAAKSLKGSRGPRGAPGARGLDGSRGATGPAATKLWAMVTSGGTLSRGSGVVSVTPGSPGSYVVLFNQNISTCGYLAQVADTGTGAPALGQVATALRFDNANALQVNTGTSAGAAQSRSFMVGVFC